MGQEVIVKLVPMDFTSDEAQAYMLVWAAFLAAGALIWGLKWIVRYLMQGGRDD